MIRVGCVGYGYWGPKLVRNFHGLPESSVTWICDLDEGRRARASVDYPDIPNTASFSDLLEDEELDAVLIATPVSHHFSLAKAALEGGKDVFIEKPITQTAAQAEELIEVARKNGRIIAVDHTFLFTAAVRKIKAIVDSGELGETLYIDSVRVNLGLFQQDVNVLYDLAPHDLSITCHLLGKDPVSVVAVGSPHPKSTMESLAYLHLEFEGGVTAHFHLSWLAPVKLRRTTICATTKMLVYDDLEASERIKIYDKGVDIEKDKDSIPKYAYRTGDMVAPYVENVEALKVEAEHFVECVRDRKQPLCDGHEGLRVARILEAAQESLRKGGAKITMEPLSRK